MSESISSGSPTGTTGPDELKITIDTDSSTTVTIAGWTEISLTRAIEGFPSSFDIRLTEKYPGTEAIVITPGRGCRVYLGSDLVLTGYIDRYESAITDTSHEVHISGRSLCEDLVDCSAFFGEYGEGFTMIEQKTIMQIAHQLCDPFNISIVNLSGDEGPVIPVISINLGETPYEILENVARWEGLLIYDNPQGQLVFNRVGTQSMASGFQQGKNVQAAQATFSADERFTDYYVLRQATNVLQDVRNSEGDAGVGNNRHGYAQDKDLKALGRYRPHYIISGIVDASQLYLGLDPDLGQRMADWEMNRRWGRSQAITLVCDSWRDKHGALWEQNKLAFVDVPAIKVNSRTWIIAAVTYHRDIQSGTTAQVVLMPPEAFRIEPVALMQGADADLVIAQQKAAAAAAKKQQLINDANSQIKTPPGNYGGGSPAETGYDPPPTAAPSPPAIPPTPQPQAEAGTPQVAVPQQESVKDYGTPDMELPVPGL